MPFEFEVYCALCGVTLDTANCRIAEQQDLRRYRRVRRRVLEKRTGDAQKDDDSELDGENEDAGDESEESDLDEWDDERNELEHSYDFRILQMEQLAWLEELCALGARPDPVDEDDQDAQHVLIRPVFEHEDGAVQVHDHAEPAEFRGRILTCYDSLGDEQPHSYPMHQSCYDMFLKFLADHRGIDEVDLCRLYTAMTTITEKYAVVLKLDYGVVTGRDQEWMSIPGEEYSVTCPMGQPSGLLSEIETFAARLSSTSAPAQPSTTSTGKDILDTLPGEIICHVLYCLPLESLKALLAASWSAYTAAQGKGFWLRYMEHCMPWLFERSDIVNHPWAAEMDFKQFCYWLDYKSRFNVNMRGPFLRITNRRRIWGVCEQLDRVYRGSSSIRTDGPTQGHS